MARTRSHPPPGLHIFLSSGVRFAALPEVECENRLLTRAALLVCGFANKAKFPSQVRHRHWKCALGIPSSFQDE